MPATDCEGEIGSDPSATEAGNWAATRLSLGVGSKARGGDFGRVLCLAVEAEEEGEGSVAMIVYATIWECYCCCSMRTGRKTKEGEGARLFAVACANTRDKLVSQ